MVGQWVAISAGLAARRHQPVNHRFKSVYEIQQTADEPRIANFLGSVEVNVQAAGLVDLEIQERRRISPSSGRRPGTHRSQSVASS